MDSFDADVLIYAGAPEHPLGRRVRKLFAVKPDDGAGVGSVLLLPEVLSKPMREGWSGEVASLASILSRLQLRAVDLATAELSTSLSSVYGLRAADAVHLATAVIAGADRFVTNNRRDFTAAISEIDIVHPGALDK